MTHPSAARTTDPATSHAAAAEVTANGVRDAQAAVVLDAVRKWPDLTSAELATKINLNRYQVARRLPELRAEGLVANGPARECTLMHRLSLTWHAVTAGATTQQTLF